MAHYSSRFLLGLFLLSFACAAPSGAFAAEDKLELPPILQDKLNACLHELKASGLELAPRFAYWPPLGRRRMATAIEQKQEPETKAYYQLEIAHNILGSSEIPFGYQLSNYENWPEARGGQTIPIIAYAVRY
jgi:hypothetical protein